MQEYSVLLQPVITEKSVRMQEKGKYTFLVRNEATKVSVKQAIEQMFGVKPKDVRMVVLPSKKRLVGRGRELTKRSVTKKAIVTLKKGETMDANKISTKDSKKK